MMQSPSDTKSTQIMARGLGRLPGFGGVDLSSHGKPPFSSGLGEVKAQVRAPSIRKKRKNRRFVPTAGWAPAACPKAP
jgi:hypothetical protein